MEHRGGFGLGRPVAAISMASWKGMTIDRMECLNRSCDETSSPPASWSTWPYLAATSALISPKTIGPTTLDVMITLPPSASRRRPC